jgi:hypothetical protein
MDCRPLWEGGFPTNAQQYFREAGSPPALTHGLEVVAKADPLTGLSDRPCEYCASVGGQQWRIWIGAGVHDTFGDIRLAQIMAWLMPPLAHCRLNGPCYRVSVAGLISEPVGIIADRESWTDRR